MRNINLKEWSVKNKEGIEDKESLLVVIDVLIRMKKPEDLPRGFEQFTLFNKLSRAFEKAKETKVLSLEEAEYKFLKDSIIKDIPMHWGANKDIFEAINAFMDVKEE